MSIIPDYNITGQQVTPQEILDVIPEQEASDRAIQASEERYLQQLEKNSADRVRNTEKMYEGLATLPKDLFSCPFKSLLISPYTSLAS